MNDFWNNIGRYPRFFISSLVGLILIIIAPFRRLRILGVISFFIILVILQKMVGFI